LPLYRIPCRFPTASPVCLLLAQARIRLLGILMRKIFLGFVFLSVAASAAAAQTCKPNQYDMLTWMAPEAATANGHYNVVYPSSGTFYWVKSSNGYPWDVDIFDRRYIYQSITEQDWNDPTTYKVFEKALPWMPRCITIPAVPGKIASIRVQPQNTNFDTHTSCSEFTTQNLGYVVNEIWGPYNQTIGSLPVAPTLTLSYRYSCDSEYNICQYKETFAMQKNNGMVRWTLYTLQNGVFVQANQTTQAAATLGAVTPVHPCW